MIDPQSVVRFESAYWKMLWVWLGELISDKAVLKTRDRIHVFSEGLLVLQLFNVKEFGGFGVFILAEIFPLL